PPRTISVRRAPATSSAAGTYPSRTTPRSSTPAPGWSTTRWSPPAAACCACVPWARTSPKHSAGRTRRWRASPGTASSIATTSAGGRSSAVEAARAMANNQYALLGQRRFLPFFLTQALGAFNDNVYRQAIIGMLFWLGVSSGDMALYANLAPALFILPYFLFSAIAGQIAEKVEKATLIRITTAMEIAIMSLAAFGFATTNMALLLVALFLTGVQSTLFGPVKYSMLPAVLQPRELTGGNGLVEMG